MENNKTVLIGVAAFLIGGLIGFSLQSTGSSRMMMDQTNSIDRHFIEQMIPHHEGAIEMAKLALERSERSEIRSLANGIIEAQTKEITDMNNWYSEWFGGSPNSGMSTHGMHHTDSSGMQGMEGDLETLRSARDFDLEFLSQMIVHHEMAVMMAEMLQSSTERDEMKTLADQIITSQNREIEMMKNWRNQWSNLNIPVNNAE